MKFTPWSVRTTSGTPTIQHGINTTLTCTSPLLVWSLFGLSWAFHGVKLRLLLEAALEFPNNVGADNSMHMCKLK